MGPVRTIAIAAGLTLLSACAGGSSTSPASPPVTYDGSLTFTNGVLAAGVESVGFGRGSAMVDLDQDGLLDLVNANAMMRNDIFRQLPGGVFEDVSDAWGIVNDMRAHWGIIAADFDNDGDDDLFVVNGGWTSPQPNQLLRNDLDSLGRFTDISLSAGDVTKASTSFSGTALDYDNDGLLDIFVTDSKTDRPSHLLHNALTQGFTDVAKAAGLDVPHPAMCSSSGDLDNDGWVDIAAGNFTGSSSLFHNQGDGTFQDIAQAAGLGHQDLNFGLVLEDFNNDGWLDLFLPKWDEQQVGQPSRLYVNRGDLTFVDATTQAGMAITTAMGHNTGDLNGDGYPDILIGTGSPDGTDLDFLYLTDVAEGTFLDASEPSGITSFGETRAHGMAIGDIDADGDVDVYFNNGGPAYLPDSVQGNALWLNEGNDSNWTTVDLTAVVSNRSAIGAHVAAWTNTGRQVHRYRQAGHGFGNTNSPVMHFAIGADTSIERLDLRWPSGIFQSVDAPAMLEMVAVVETGLLLSEDSSTLRAVGPAGHEVELLVGSAGAPDGLPLASLVLGADGQAELALDTALAGSGAWVRAWIHDPADPDVGTLTPELTL